MFIANVGPSAIPFDFDWCVPFEFQCVIVYRGHSDWVKLYLGQKNGRHVLGCQCGYHFHPNLIDSVFLDNEFTQLMKGLQGERVRQAFKYLDKDQDGFIRPEEFKQIILVCEMTTLSMIFALIRSDRKLLGTNYLMQSLNVCPHYAP